MSHARNKVDWCLKKAEKERSEGKKHRGLVKIDNNIKSSREHIEKAEHNLGAIEYFNNGGYSDWSLSASFYCIYHCFLAICSKFGYESRNQECTFALIKYLKETGKIDIDNIFIESLEIYDEKERHESNIIEKRESYTYGTTISVDDDSEIEKNIKICKDCLDVTKRIVFG